MLPATGPAPGEHSFSITEAPANNTAAERTAGATTCSDLGTLHNPPCSGASRLRHSSSPSQQQPTPLPQQADDSTNSKKLLPGRPMQHHPADTAAPAASLRPTATSERPPPTTPLATPLGAGASPAALRHAGEGGRAAHVATAGGTPGRTDDATPLAGLPAPGLVRTSRKRRSGDATPVQRSLFSPRFLWPAGSGGGDAVLPTGLEATAAAAAVVSETSAAAAAMVAPQHPFAQ